MTTPDSSKCIAVAISMTVYTFFAMAVLKSSSVLYVGSMEMLNLNRQEASWPATLGVMLSQLAGPAYGIMLKYTSERVCLIFGALLCSLPLMASAYAQDILTLCVLVGLIQGFGTACSEVVPFVVLMRHFQKYRGTVISAIYIVTAVSGFLMPVLYEYVRQSFGFRVCLFVMGAVNLGMLLGCIVVNRIPAESPAPAAVPSTHAPSAIDVSMSTDSYLVGSILFKSHQQSYAGSFVDVGSLKERSSLLKTANLSRHFGDDKPGILSISFLHITISRAATVFALAAYLMVLLDYSTDRHLDSVQGVFVLTVFTIGDLLSRILSGSIIDLRLLSHASLMSITFLVQGTSYLLLIYVDIYVIMLVASFLVGLTGGCRNILATMLVTEECEESKLAISLGIMNFVTGITIFFQPMIIGYVRDSLGSYEPLLIAFVACNFVLSCTWLMKVLCESPNRRDRYLPL